MSALVHKSVVVCILLEPKWIDHDYIPFLWVHISTHGRDSDVLGGHLLSVINKKACCVDGFWTLKYSENITYQGDGSSFSSPILLPPLTMATLTSSLPPSLGWTFCLWSLHGVLFLLCQYLWVGGRSVLLIWEPWPLLFLPSGKIFSFLIYPV